jgi:hypothetical protein
MLILSCHNDDIDYHLLMGSWKLRDVKDMTGENITDKVTFFAHDSVSIEIFSDGKLLQEYSGKYKVQEKNKVLTIKYGSNLAIDNKIQKLTDKEIELQNPSKKLPDRYSRY